MNLKTILNKKTAHNTRLTSLLLGGGKIKNPPLRKAPKRYQQN
jgi:hypothetical protein